MGRKDKGGKKQKKKGLSKKEKRTKKKAKKEQKREGIQIKGAGLTPLDNSKSVNQKKFVDSYLMGLNNSPISIFKFVSN